MENYKKTGSHLKVIENKKRRNVGLNFPQSAEAESYFFVLYLIPYCWFIWCLQTTSSWKEQS